ncbi:hypothetical protein [Luteolibacter luteus]|uniref:Uncharacterized protein n=1 Tax=Luteolibacter luteus TaxID=2728835 RepID=A0A858RIB0_9BACT|nr:hypothetical protein [Luteolibacter luteus]QJE96637.1 hypothetical protein HHL09_12865 [Luteolibacter luteus]
MRIGRVLAALLASGISLSSAEEAPYVREKPKGHLKCPELREASGLATSPTSNDFLWLINDSGCPAEIHLAENDGGDRGKISLSHAKNHDWEDLDSFILDGKPYLLIADTGDNASKRSECMLYIVPEPTLPEKGEDLSGQAKPAWKIRFHYEDGPRDCEAVGVDAQAGKILLLSKRTSPPMLYELPLKPASDELQTAKKIGEIPKTLPAGFPPIPFGTQPTGMDIAADGSAAAVVTYYGLFLFPRASGETWAKAFSRPPELLGAHRMGQVESVAFSRDSKVIRLVAEGGKSPVARYVKAEKGN